jgi:hypothetical protein
MGKIKNILHEAAIPVTETVNEIKDNPGFSKKLDLSREAITDGSDEYKRECVGLVENRRAFALKYSAIFCIGALLYLCVYGLVGANAAIGGVANPFGKLDLIQILLPLIIIPSVIASLMRFKAIVLTITLYLSAAAYFLVIWHFVVIVPFLIIGAIVHIRVSNVCGAHDVLQTLRGYPDFMPLSKDIVAKKTDKVTHEKPLIYETADNEVTFDFSASVDIGE